MLRFQRSRTTSSYREAIIATSALDTVCPCCLGVLQRLPKVVDSIAAAVKGYDFAFDDFNISLVLPASLHIRQWGFWHHLVQREVVSGTAAGETVVDCKEVLKLLLPTALEEKLESKYSTKSEVLLNIKFTSDHLTSGEQTTFDRNHSISSLPLSHTGMAPYRG